MNDRQGPLSGIRVIDFGHYVAGPLVGMLLADQGADVVKVDRPGCQHSITLQSAVFNRNKRRTMLDLKNDRDMKRAVALLESADVVIENFRPGVMARLGLGGKRLTSLHPRLIYLSLPGFASTDLESRDIRAFEGVLGAATGLFTDLQELRRLLGARPVYTPIPVASTYGAIHGATAVTLALYHREATGRGEQIEVPLAAAALSALAIINMKIEDRPKRYAAPALTDAERGRLPEWRAQVAARGDAAIAEIGTEIRDQNQPTTANYQASDGNWLYFVGAGHGPNTRGILKMLGIYDDLITAGMVDLPVLENLHLSNNIADGPGWSRGWNREVRLRIEEAVARKPAKTWEAKMVANGLPAVAHRTSHEWLNAPESLEAGLVVDVPDPTHGTIRQIGLQTQLSSSPDEICKPKPCRDVLPLDIIAEWQNLKQPSERVAKTGPILDGLRVLDLSNVLAGPVSGRTLAEYGADVIKIDPTEPNFGPRISHMFPMEASPGKRSMILNLKSPEGHAVFCDMVKRADVVIHNFKPGAAEGMKIGYEDLKALNPDLIYLNVTAFNGPLPGPWMDRGGFDPVLQAATGIQLRYGGKGQPPRYHGWASCIDYITGFSGAFGVALALLRNRRNTDGPRGDLVTTSLAQGAQLVQAPLLVESINHRLGAEPHGQDALGTDALNRLYEASDGWLFLAAQQTEVGVLKDVLGIASTLESEGHGDPTLEQCILQSIKKQPVAFWVEQLRKAGIAAHRVCSLDSVCARSIHEGTSGALTDLWNDGRTFSWVRFTDHPFGAPVELSAPGYARLKNAPLRLLFPTPKQGDHTKEILREFAHDSDTIARLLNAGAAKVEQSKRYLPF